MKAIGEDVDSSVLTESDVRLMRDVYYSGKAEIEQIKETVADRRRLVRELQSLNKADMERVMKLKKSCSTKAIAEKFGCHWKTATLAIQGYTWRHVK